MTTTKKKLRIINDRTTEKTWRVNYRYDGYGHAYVKGATEDEAMENYYDGNYEDTNDDSDNYEVEGIELVED